MPRVSASKPPSYSSGNSTLSRRSSVPSGGIMISAITTAAGALIMDAVSRCPAGSDTMPDMKLAYTANTVPAIVAIPAVIIMNSSERLMFVRYGRTNSGDSTMPIKTFEAVAKLAAPLIRSVLPNTHANPNTIHGRTL